MANNVKWIKLDVGLFDNRKIKQIECLPDGNAIIVIWLKLLCLAGSLNENGTLMFTSEIPYTEQMLASQFGARLEILQLALRTFEAFGMIEIVDSIMRISNWEKYQDIERLDEIREKTRRRVQKHRANKALNGCNVTCNAGVTPCNAVETEGELKERDNKSDIHVAQSEQPRNIAQEFDVLWGMYPARRKQGKTNAWRAYQRARQEGITYETVRAKLKEYIAYVEENKIQDRYIKYGKTWFCDKCWEDDYEEAPEQNASYGDPDEFCKAAIERGREETT